MAVNALGREFLPATELAYFRVMNPETLIETYTAKKTFSPEIINGLRSNPSLRLGLCTYLRTDPNHAFAVALIDKFIELRKDLANGVGMEDLMFGAYLLGLHGQVEDCLLVWDAKQVDVDAYSGVDVQLVVFAGIEATFDFLESQHTDKSREILAYLQDCRQAGDFDDLEGYFDPGNLPWWL